MLDDYVANGGDVNNLGAHDKIYRHIKNTKLKDKDGNYIGLETKFELLGYPRKPKYVKDNKTELIEDIKAYKNAGGSFHIRRKSLPFYARLQAYSAMLKRQGLNLTYEEIMKGLGFRDYSDTYYRCKGIFDLKKYRDNNGFVDSYRKNEKMKAYVLALAEHLELPYYLVVTLLADEKLEKCFIDTEYIKYVQTELQNYVAEHGSLKNIKVKDKSLYFKFNTLIRYYSDGSEIQLSKADWLNLFGLEGVEHDFREVKHKTDNIEDIMDLLKKNFADEQIKYSYLTPSQYYSILQKAIQLAIPVKELFRNYGLNYDGNTVDRLSKMQVSEIPYLQDMKLFIENSLKTQGISEQNGYCREEVFEAKVKACKQAYEKYKDKIYNFTTDNATNLEDVTNF